MLSPSQEHLLLSQKGRSLEAKGKDATITLFLSYFGSILALVRNTVILQCFNAVGWEDSKGIRPVKVLLQQFPEFYICKSA